MAKFISISGPSSTGKTTIMNFLRLKGVEGDKVVLTPDMYSVVWDTLKSEGHFTSFDDITRDSDYLCIYIVRLLDYYEEIMSKYDDYDGLVVLDGCWVDLSIYAIINMWYKRTIIGVQEEILERVNRFSDKILKIYFTSFDKSQQHVEKYQEPYRIANRKLSRSLEILFYELAHHYQNACVLPSSDALSSAAFIEEDLKKLGYLHS